jgi:hypothetical protein
VLRQARQTSKNRCVALEVGKQDWELLEEDSVESLHGRLVASRLLRAAGGRCSRKVQLFDGSPKSSHAVRIHAFREGAGIGDDLAFDVRRAKEHSQRHSLLDGYELALPLANDGLAIL